MNKDFINISDLNIRTKIKVTNSSGKKEEIDFIFPAIVELKDDYCVIHNKSFKNECHRLPSLKLHWMGCPFCKSINNQIAAINLVNNHMKENDMKWDRNATRECGKGTGEWVSMNPTTLLESENNSNKIKWQK